MNSVYLFGQRIDCLSKLEFVETIKLLVKKKVKKYIFALNVNILVKLYKDPSFNKGFSKESLIFADGMPIVWMSNLINDTKIQRVNGTDLTEALLQSGLKIFIIGSYQSVVEKIIKKFPKNICGSYIPPFGEKWNDKVDLEIIRAINRTQSELLLVAVGSLKQEKWLKKHFKKLDIPVGIGVGAALDILSGEKPRAPKVLWNIGLEWFWRMIQEPQRLGFRYCHDFIWLIYIILKSIKRYIVKYPN